MNPILSSEADFDAYVQSRLQFSRAPRNLGSTSREKSSVSAKVQYGVSTASSSASARSSGQYAHQKFESKVADVVTDEPYEIKHSWKAHLSSSKPHTIQMPYNQPPRSSYFVNESVSEPKLKTSDSVEDSMPSIPYGDFSVPLSIVDYSSTKIRTFRLRKLFKAWRLVTNKSLVQVIRAQSTVIDLHQENLLILFFDAWRNYWTAIHHHREVYFRFRISFFYRWQQRIIARIRRKKRVMYMRKRRGLLGFQHLIRYRRRKQKIIFDKAAAMTFRCKKLLKGCWQQWITITRRAKHTKDIFESRKTTQDRIHQFLHRLEENKHQQPPVAPAPVTVTKTVGTGSSIKSNISVSRARSASRGRPPAGVLSSSRLQPATAVTSKSKQQAAPPYTEFIGTVDQGDASSPIASAHKPPSPRKMTSRPLDGDSPYRNEMFQKVTHGLANMALMDHDDNNDDELPPPPSYRQFVSGGDNAPLEAFSKEGNSKAQEEKVDKELDGLSRKERLAVLQHRAMDRVKHRQQLEQEKAMEKKKHLEDIEADRLLQEGKLKKAKTTQNKQQLDELRGKVSISDNFRRRTLLINRGFAPWRRLILHRQHMYDDAVSFHRDHILPRYWHNLLAYYTAAKTERVRREYRQSAMAVAHYRRRFLRQHWWHWQLHRRLIRTRASAATGHFSRYTLPRRCFAAWRLAYQRSLRDTAIKIQQVRPRGDVVVKKFYWQRWMQYLKGKRVEHELDFRSEMKWQAVQSWLTRK